MALYFSAHTTACLTKQALRDLMKELMMAPEVSIRRCVSSQLGGRMLIEVEAADRESLEKFFAARHINSEWMMRIDLDAHDGAVKEY